MERKIHPLSRSQSMGSMLSQNSFDSKLKKLADTILVDQEEENSYSLESARLACKEFFTNTFLGDVYNNALLLLSVFSCAQFIQQTYSDVDRDSAGGYTELIIAIIFTWDWCLNCFIADHKILFFTRCDRRCPHTHALSSFAFIFFFFSLDDDYCSTVSTR